jgi:digeranylgeranylglycerophospholipid reductase
MQKIRSDVAVIGAGPAGSTTARTIARRGFDVTIIERDKTPGLTNVCAGGINRSLVSDIGLNNEVIEKEVRLETHYFPWGVENLPIDCALVYRHVFDKRLAEKAVEEGAVLLTSTLIDEISVSHDGVTLSSADTTIESRMVVFADGPNTLACKKFGIGFKPDMDKTAIAVISDVEWVDNPLDRLEFFYGPEIAPWGYGWIFPKKNTVNVGVVCLYSKIHTNIADSLNILLCTHPLTRERFKGKKPGEFRSATIPFAPAKKILGDRMLVVGDAAGMVDCITGGGIAPAIKGGQIAGRVCADALEKEDCSERFLSYYLTELQKSLAYSNVHSRYLLSNLFLYLSKFDENAFPKLMALGQNKPSNIVKTLKSIYFQ